MACALLSYGSIAVIITMITAILVIDMKPQKEKKEI